MISNTQLKSIILLIIVLVFRNSVLDAQPLSFHHIRMENGLPNNSVISITQDKNGFIWLGSTIGLTRCDGIKFKTYKNNQNDTNSLSANHINSLLTDSEGTLWVGTTNGLDKYNIQKDNFERVWINGGRVGNIYCIYQDSKRQLWVGTSNGLHIILPDRVRKSMSFYNTNNYLPGKTVKAIIEDKKGIIWAATDNGLSRIQPGSKFSFTNYKLQPTTSEKESLNYLTSINIDNQNNIWVGTQGGGIYSFKPEDGKFYSLKENGFSGNDVVINNNIRCIAKDNAGYLWVGTQEGISVLDPKLKTIQNYAHNAEEKESLSQNSIYSFFQDSNGSMWVGTYFGGANIIYAYNTPFFKIQNKDTPFSISNNVVSSIVEDKYHNLWIGTEGGGLNYYNRQTGQFFVYKHNSNSQSLGSNLVKAVFIDSDGNVWAGTHGGGLNVLQPESKTFKKYLYSENNPESLNSEIFSICEDSEKNLWVATNTGIKVFKRTGLSLFPASIKNISFTSNLRLIFFYKDTTGNLWISCDQGIFISYNNTIRLVDKNISANCFSEGKGGNIWMGKSTGGLALYNKKTNRIQTEIGDNYIRSLNIVGLLTDNEDGVWMSTDKGIINYNYQNNSYQVYNQNDGLPGNEFNYNSYLKDSKGLFYFGGFNGISFFYPEQIKRNSYVAPILFTALKLGNVDVPIGGTQKLLKQNINVTQKLSFAHNQNVFTIDFALLNYIKSQKNKYLYKLAGFDEEWHETHNPSVTYTNLAVGNYELMVKGANNDGVFSNVATLQITIRPPFWLTWWAYLIYAGIIAAILFFITRFFYLRALYKKENELHQVKLNFFTNVSHEIMTHLTLIMAPVEHVIKDTSANILLQQQLKQVKNNTHRLHKLVNELLDFRKAETKHLKLYPNKQNLVAFLQDIYDSYREESLSKNISLSYVYEQDIIEATFDNEQMQKVFYNLISNAFKFTPNGGRIELFIEDKNDYAIVTVTDNGRGISPKYIDKLFTNFFQVHDHGHQNTGYGIGLALAKNIVELHKGTIKAESFADSNTESKTVFTVAIPKNAKISGSHEAKEHNNTISYNNPEFQLTHLELSADMLNEENDAEEKLTILAIDDNLEICDLIKNMLTPNYKVITAENGVEGWNVATEKIPDLIISDVMMPEMDGYTLVHKLKTDERTCHIPVILLTAKSSQPEQINGLQSGANVYITKPFSTKVLALNVRNLVAIRKNLQKRIKRDVENIYSFVTINKNGSNLTSSYHNLDQEFIQKIISIIEEYMDHPDFNVEMLSRKVAMSVPVLYKKLRALTNLSVNDFIKQIRLKRAAVLLLQKRMTVYEVAYAVGYNDRKYFSKEFKKYFGKLPSDFESETEEQLTK